MISSTKKNDRLNESKSCKKIQRKGAKESLALFFIKVGKEKIVSLSLRLCVFAPLR